MTKQTTAVNKPQQQNGRLIENVRAAVERDPEIARELTQIPQIQTFVQTFYQGPLPSVDQFGGYEQILPGAAERILAMAEAEQRHRQALEIQQQTDGADIHKVAIAGQIQINKRGQWFGFSICFAVLLLAGYFAYLGFGTAAAAMASLDLVSLAAVFVIGRQTKNNQT
jgi:uncharacterized membrane protein